MKKICRYFESYDIERWPVEEFSARLQEEAKRLCDDHGIEYSQIVKGPEISLTIDREPYDVDRPILKVTAWVEGRK